MPSPAPRNRSLPAAVRAAAHELDLPGRSVLVAVSGGVDSSALLHALADLRGELALELSVAHVNHGLRGAGSDADQAAVEAQAAALGLRCEVARVAPEALQEGPSRTRPTLQEAARRVRHDALRAVATRCGAGRVALAHNLDDQAETVLLRLLRGSGPDGLGGMAPQSPDGVLVRPLLAVSRVEIERYAREQGITWCEDPSNADSRFARARMRAGGLAELASRINPNWLRAVGDLAEAQRTDAAWSSAEAERAASRLLFPKEGALWIERSGWAELPDALARRVARIALRRMGASRDVSRAHLGRILDFLGNGRPGSGIELPGDLWLEPSGEGFWLQRRSAPRGVQLPRQC